ncbi:MAG: NAD(P)/FAD-dependent oxidoreductase [Candidatus Competibacterales bacterium]
MTAATALPPTAEVVVVGAGLHGCSVALHLALKGLKPLVLEKDYPGRHASGVNAGGVRTLGRHSAEIPLALASRELWHHMVDLVGDDCGFVKSGQVKVAEDEADLARLATRVGELTALGYDHEVLIDQHTLRELLPAVAPHCIGGIFVADDGYANPYRTVHAFRQRAKALGVQFVPGVEVTGLEPRANTWRLSSSAGSVETPRVINCAGAWGQHLAAWVDEPVPLRAKAPMLMVTGPLPPFVGPVVGAAGRPLSFKQYPNGTVVIGGGHTGRARPETNATQLDIRALASSARTARAIFPIMARASIVRAWAGIEGYCADGIPVIGNSRHPGLYHAFGFSAHGYQLGPAVGAALADLVVEGHSNMPLEPFAIHRFTQPVQGC